MLSSSPTDTSPPSDGAGGGGEEEIEQPVVIIGGGDDDEHNAYEGRTILDEAFASVDGVDEDAGTGIGIGIGSARTDSRKQDEGSGEEGKSIDISDEETKTTSNTLLSQLRFRTVSPTDIPACYTIESKSYPPDEAASKTSLQYRQHHAAPYFRCAVLPPLPPPSSFDPTDVLLPTPLTNVTISNDGREVVVGYICSTRCAYLTKESMSSHDPTGTLLAIHSVAVDEPYRKRGVAKAMLMDYIDTVKRMDDGVEKLVLLSKAYLIPFYVKCGFRVMRASHIVHGKDTWYELEMDLDKSNLGSSGSNANSTAVVGDDEAGAMGTGGTEQRPCWIVDSFARGYGISGSGNPAAVVMLSPGEIDTKEKEEELVPWMQLVAKEFNLSETAFLWDFQGDDAAATPVSDDTDSFASEHSPSHESKTVGAGEAHYNVRYYTCNGTEIDLCGHATLASASVLYQHTASSVVKDVANIREIVFHAKRDVLRAKKYYPESTTARKKKYTKHAMRIQMDFPWKTLCDVTDETDTSIILSMMQEAFDFPEVAMNVLYVGVDNNRDDLFIELTTEAFDALRYEGINYMALTKWEGYNRGIIVCCRGMDRQSLSSSPTPLDMMMETESIASSASSSSRRRGRDDDDDTIIVDFKSRFFGPKAGIDEDPVTGSAHCILGPYFGKKVGKRRVVGKQMSSRGGIVECVLKEEVGADGEMTGRKRVGIIGTALVTMSGTLYM